MSSGTRRPVIGVLLASVVLVLALMAPGAQAAGTTNDPPKVMTRNLYLGANLNPALAALSCTPQPYCLFQANQGIWNAVVATDFPARAKSLAKEIDDDDPYVVGLQEVALWRSGTANGLKDAGTVEYDFLDLLLKQLAARGNKYEAAVTQQEADIESPAGSQSLGFTDLRDRRLTMRDVILVRTDLPKGRVSFSNPQSGQYTNYIHVPTGSSYGDIDFKRGWTSIDASIANKPAVRIVNTHLESAASGYRTAQAYELVGGFGTGPLRTSIPAIVVGDLNSDPDIAYVGDSSGVSDGNAFNTIVGAGFTDSGNTDKTFGHAANLLDFPSNTFTETIDHVLTRPSLPIASTKVVGTDPDNRAVSIVNPSNLLWPSDHGGLIVRLG